MNKTRISLRLVLAVLVVGALAAVPALSPAAAPRPGTYKGKTAQGRSVTVRVNAAATAIRSLRIVYVVTCSNGEKVNTAFTIRRIRIRDGRFRASAEDTRTLSDGAQVHHDVRVRGAFVSSRRVT